MSFPSVRRHARLCSAAFALLWSLSVHDKTAPDARFLEGLALIEKYAKDDRNFVRKAVNMALRAIAFLCACSWTASAASRTASTALL